MTLNRDKTAGLNLWPVGLKGSVCVVARSLRIAADTLLTRASHPDPFEANGMPPTDETMH